MGDGNSINSRRAIAVIAGFAVLVGLYFASSYNYLLFHVLAEGFSIAVACGTFMVAWNARRFIDNNYVLFIGVAFLFIAGLDLLHTMSYKGMNIFPGHDANLPTQLWISARYMQSVSLFVAPLLIGRVMSANRVLGTYAAVFTLLLWAIFAGFFPACFIDGQGLTPFKKTSEYVIVGISLGSMYLLYLRRDAFDRWVLYMLYASVALTICSEFAFTFYVSVYGFSNLVGHYLKLVAFVLVYRAFVVTGLREPYSLLFRNLKESEDRLRSFSEATFEGIVISDEGRILDMNKQAVALFGYASPSEVAGINGFDLVAPESLEMVKRIIAEGYEKLYEATFMRKDGSKFEAEVHGRMFDHQGRHVRMAAIRDVTERKRADRKLQAENSEIALANKILRVFVEETGDDLFDKALNIVLEGTQSRYGVFGYIDENGVLVCPSLTKLLDQCEVEGKCIYYPPEKWKGLWKRALVEKRVLFTNMPSKVPPGHPPIQNNLAVPVLFHDRAIGLFNLANKDAGYADGDKELMESISDRLAPTLYAWIQKELRENERKRAEEAIRESEERFRSVAQSASDAIISSDHDGNIVFWNAAAETVFGYSAEEALGKPLTMIMPGPLRQRHEDAMAGVRSTGQLKGFGRTSELEGVRKDGAVFPIEISLSRWKTAKGVFFSAIIRDITKRRLAEEELGRYREHLEDIVNERTKELMKAYEELEQQIAERNKAEAQLVQSQKMEAVGVLAGGIAHDFNNRLFAIRNYAHILKAVAKDASTHETLEKLIISCDRAAGLVDDLLRFSRKKAINPKPVDANSIVKEARSILEMAAGRKVEFAMELSPEPLQVMADASNMEHVLLNLVNNAHDVMPEGGKITVSTRKEEAGAVPAGARDGGEACPCAVISVSDTGPGLQEGIKERIFEPFFTTKEIGKGTGLGLSIVYGVVKQHGGFMDVVSEPGRGTTFRIFLPLLK